MDREKQTIRLARRLEAVLRPRRLVCATAESCTGGWIAQVLTSIPGSSDWFERGFVVYSNTAKTEALGVPRPVLNSHGAVSEATARAMAKGALSHSGADVSIAVTGIAGPDGGSVDKPVGTVCFGWALAGGAVETCTRRFDGDRSEIRWAAVNYAIDELCVRLARR